MQWLNKEAVRRLSNPKSTRTLDLSPLELPKESLRESTGPRIAFFLALVKASLVSAIIGALMAWYFHLNLIDHAQHMSTQYQGAYDPDRTFYWHIR